MTDRMGWICPTCGTANAPHVPQCCTAAVPHAAAASASAAPYAASAAPHAAPHAAAASPDAGKKALGSRSKPQAPNYEEPNFKAFWEVYPLKKGKASAARKFAAAVAAGVAPQLIIDGAMRYRNDSSRDAAFTKWPEGWLTARRWEDEDVVAAPVQLSRRRSQDLIYGSPEWKAANPS